MFNPWVYEDQYLNTWAETFTDTAASEAGNYGLPNPWVSCPGSGLGGDPGGTVITDSNSLVNYAICGLTMHWLLTGSANDIAIFDEVRTRQAGLSFTDYPQWAIEPF
jgi:hypothetical protein